MMLKLIFTFSALLWVSGSFAQKTEKILLNKTDSSKNCYTLIYPPTSDYKGYLFLIPGFGETAERVWSQTDLPKLAAEQGLLTVIPTFQDGVLSFGIDSLSQRSLREMIREVSDKHNLTGKRLFIGGFSLGGSCAIKYAEDATLKPTAVFAIDPPLDFERFYHSSKRDVRLSVNERPNQENVYMIERIEQEFKGTPATALVNFHRISPYSLSDTNQSAVKKIGQLPLRIYAEPDVQWWLKERKSDFTGMNVIDCSALINELNRMGNKNAVLITTQNKGYRQPGGKRHPHSWSIADNKELIEWLFSQK